MQTRSPSANSSPRRIGYEAAGAARPEREAHPDLTRRSSTLAGLALPSSACSSSPRGRCWVVLDARPPAFADRGDGRDATDGDRYRSNGDRQLFVAEGGRWCRGSVGGWLPALRRRGRRPVSRSESVAVASVVGSALFAALWRDRRPLTPRVRNSPTEQPAERACGRGERLGAKPYWGRWSRWASVGGPVLTIGMEDNFESGAGATVRCPDLPAPMSVAGCVMSSYGKIASSSRRGSRNCSPRPRPWTGTSTGTPTRQPAAADSPAGWLPDRDVDLDPDAGADPADPDAPGATGLEGTDPLVRRWRIEQIVAGRAEMARLQAFEARHLAALSDTVEAHTEPGVGGERLEWAFRSLTAELAVACRVSSRTMQSRLAEAHLLVEQFPATLTAWQAGRIEAGHVRTIMLHGGCIDDADARARYEGIVLQRAALVVPGPAGQTRPTDRHPGGQRVLRGPPQESPGGPVRAADRRTMTACPADPVSAHPARGGDLGPAHRADQSHPPGRRHQQRW